MVISDTYNIMFRNVRGARGYGGTHKIVHSCLILNEWCRGVVKDAPRESHSEVCAVNRYNVEHVCQCIADGRAVIAAFNVGPHFLNWNLGMFILPPLDSKTGRHAVVLIGAIVSGSRVIYIFLNSWGIEFCVVYDENGNIIVGGIGMVEGDLCYNPLVLSRSWEEGGWNHFKVSWRTDLEALYILLEYNQMYAAYGRPVFNFKQDSWAVPGPFQIAIYHDAYAYGEDSDHDDDETDFQPVYNWLCSTIQDT